MKKNKNICSYCHSAIKLEEWFVNFDINLEAVKFSEFSGSEYEMNIFNGYEVRTICLNCAKKRSLMKDKSLLSELELLKYELLGKALKLYKEGYSTRDPDAEPAGFTQCDICDLNIYVDELHVGVFVSTTIIKKNNLAQTILKDIGSADDTLSDVIKSEEVTSFCLPCALRTCFIDNSKMLKKIDLAKQKQTSYAFAELKTK